MMLRTYSDEALRVLMREIQEMAPAMQAGLGVTIAELDCIARILRHTDPLTEEERTECDRIREKYLSF